MIEQEQPSGDSAVVEPVTAQPSETVTEERDFDLETGELIEPTPVEEDEIEEELDGLRLRGKKEAIERAKAERLMHADYTRKTQEVAEQRRAFEAERAQFSEAAQAHQQFLEEVAEVRGIQGRLQQLSQVNVQQLIEQDPVAALRLQTEITQLQARNGQLVNSLTQKNQARQQAERDAESKRTAEAEAVVMREVKDWSPAKYKEFQDFGRQVGIEPEALRRMLVNVPQSAKLLQMALVHDRLQKQRAAKPAAEPEKPPVTRVSGAAATARKDPSDMSDAEFNAWRKRQIAQRK